MNLVDRRLEIYRSPVADGTARFGWRYGQLVTLDVHDAVSPLAAPGARVTVTDLLP